MQNKDSQCRFNYTGSANPLKSDDKQILKVAFIKKP